MNRIMEILQTLGHSSWVVVSPKGHFSEVQMESEMPLTNWEILRPIKRSKYLKYDTQLKVIVSSRRLLFTKAFYEALGKPTHIQIALDAVHERIGFRACHNASDGYLVCGKPKTDASREHTYVFAKTICDKNLLKNKAVYDAYKEADWLVVNINSHPAIV